ncbi:NLR family CARD domain-containing protein 4-like [Patiria miniata]|uniref:NACHT domain-containing protein n=1 Tax=Patiria miniata TaxID=46514 RepID=A0A913ZNW7_PATMI|nr:NLR family CARD domain-containing protein 4-like [Patiria miniata]
MASPDNMTTVPAAPTVPKPTPAGSGLTAGDWAAIGTCIGIVGLSLTLIGVILTYYGRRRRSNSQSDGGEEGIPLRSMPSTSAESSGSSARQQQPGSCTTQETRRDDPAQLAANKCEKELNYIYETTGSYVQMLPWVDDDKRHIMDIYTKLQLEKDNDDLKGEVKSYWDIFKLKSREGYPIIRAILRGWAGLGKTTLLDKIAYDWACGTVAALKKYKLVFVLKMHSLQQKSDVIEAVFDQLLDEKTINREDLKSFITANPEDVLFLLDGFDEFKSTKLDETEFGSILKMLNRKGEYKKCGILVTTRPSHYDKLVKNTLIEKPFALVEVLGFSKDDIKEYVRKYYSQELSKANGLLERITSSDVLKDLAQSPMLLLLMCLLWSESATLPDTMFRLYKEALRYIFKRKTQMSTEEISRLVIAIGKVALGGLLSYFQKLSFQEEDFEPDVLDMAIRAGILTSQRVFKGIDTCKNVHFIHKTFQEVCAAIYYQSLTSNKETKRFETFFRKVSDTAGFEYLLRFCCGDNDGTSTNSILKILSHQVRCGDLDDRNLHIALDCHFESQSKKLPPTELINSVIASNVQAVGALSGDHSTSLMYFLNNVTDEKKSGGNARLKRIRSLSITPTTFRRLGVDFVNQVNRMARLKSMFIGGVYPPTHDSQNDLSRLISSLRLKKMTQLYAVFFRGCVLTGSAMEHIFGELSNLTNFVELYMFGNRILARSGQSWYHLKKIKTLNKLNLSACELESDDLEPIAVGLSNLPNFVELDLSRNQTLAGSGQSWSHLGKIKTLTKLTLENCALKSDDLEPIAVGLSNLPKLVELDLSRNQTLAGSGQSWSHLGEIKTLTKLTLEYCALKSDDLELIAVGLSNLPKLVELDLYLNKTLAGSGLSWSHLREIKTLNKLDLKDCELKREDLEPIADGLSNLPKLVELDLSRNQTLAGSGRSWSHLGEIKTLTKLTLHYCALKSEDLEPIAIGLKNLPNLAELDLSRNEALIGDYNIK